MTSTIFFKSKNEFIEWLDQNHKTEKELWIGYYKKNSKKESMTWSESVDCALLFGWIDGIRKSIDSESYKIRFTPRKLNSVWSKVNVDKVQTLIDLEIMRPEGMEVFLQRKDREGYSAVTKSSTLPKEYEDRIKANQESWDFYCQLAVSYKRDSIWWIMSAKKESTQIRRLNQCIESWSQSRLLRP